MAPLPTLLLGFVLLNAGTAPSATSDASSLTSLMLNASTCLDASVCDSDRGKAATQFLQAQVSRLKKRGPSGASASQVRMSSPTSLSPQMQKVLYVAGGILLPCFLLVLKFASVDVLMGIATFLDHFMSMGLLPFLPSVTPNYQLIAALQSSKNVVVCLLAPFLGRFIDKREAKFVQLGMLCGMLCSLGFALKKSYAFWFAMRTLMGFSTASVLWGSFAYINRMYASDSTARVKAVSTATAGLYAGMVAGPQAAGILVDSRLMFLVLSGLQMCLWLALRFRLPDLSQLQEPMPKPTEPVEKVHVLELMLDPEIRFPIVALFLGVTLEAALGATTWEYMTSLGYDHLKQNLTWLMVTIPGVISVNLVPALRSLVEGHTLQISAILLGGASALACFGSHYVLLALALLGTSGASGVLNGNGAAMLADRSQEKYDGTGQVFVLSMAADQAAFIFGPYLGSSLCRYESYQVMCHVIGGCLVLSAILLSWRGEGSEAKQNATNAAIPPGTEPGTPAEAGRS
ncbi:slc18a3a [Symbiodinium natans]|uniref:Slc18a3a protein n=1 Tax=Symbiodinium natans TaxID=878477 RepID=A0A812SPI6_9DINO|nr:slc18a3a [Symbiodinium natans]